MRFLLIFTSGLISALAFLEPFLAICFAGQVQIEAGGGPYAEASSSLVGLSSLPDSDDLLVASKHHGLFRWLAKNQSWQTLPLKKEPFEIASLNSLTDQVLLFLGDGTAVSLPKKSTTPEAAQFFRTEKPLTLVRDCTGYRVGSDGKYIYRINKDWSLVPLESSGEMRIRALECKDDLILVGTEDQGLVKCSYDEKMSCDKNYYRFPYSHIRAISYNSINNSWIIGIYGGVENNIVSGDAQTRCDSDDVLARSNSR